jgi:DNA polymerase III subunit epsilon
MAVPSDTRHRSSIPTPINTKPHLKIDTRPLPEGDPMSKKLILSTNPVPHRAVLLDTETTGFTPKQGHKIVELAAIELIDGVPSGARFHTYINPMCHVPAAASNVHGLTNAFLRDKPRFCDIAANFFAFIGSAETPLWAHSASFDQRFIEAEMSEANLPISHAFSCSLRLARAVPHGASGNKLEHLAAHINFQWGSLGAHSAIEDTLALSAVLTKLLWPLEAEVAAKQPAKSAKPKTAKPTSPAPSSTQTVPELPEGFQPLCEVTDDRIRRYDDLSVNGRIFARGKRWSEAEAGNLVKRFLKDKASIDTLVSEHGRTPAGLMLKLEGLGIIAPGHPYSREA